MLGCTNQETVDYNPWFIVGATQYWREMKRKCENGEYIEVRDLQLDKELMLWIKSNRFYVDPFKYTCLYLLDF